MPRSDLMRLFVAVVPPPAVQRAAFAVSEALRRPEDRVSWVRAENLHLTLRFLGDLGADGARRVAEAADEAAAGTPAFEAALGGAGAFPDGRRARVLWIGLERGDEPLAALAAALEGGLRRRGFERADRAFSPHLTLGRPRTPGLDWSARLAALPAVDPAAAGFRVDRLVVLESRLSPRGSTYTPRHAARLAG